MLEAAQMNEAKGCQDCCLANVRITKDAAADKPCAELIRRLIRAEIGLERARAAAEEAAQWDRAFAAAGPANRKTRNNPIVRTACARSLLANMSKPP
jgi:hypothetical protein